MRKELFQKKLKRLSLSADDKYFFRKYGPLVARMRRDPVLQARLIHGIVVPPHERAMMRPVRQDYREYHVIGSRGIAKSFAMCSLMPTLNAEVYARRKILVLSASKFRGGKVIMEEALSLIRGVLQNQRPLSDFSPNMLVHKAGVKREADRWYIPFTTNTILVTVPTGNEESIRGLRAQELYLDEADNWDEEVISKIVKPFLAVGTDFESTASDSNSNKILRTGTISSARRGWAKVLTDRMVLLRKRFEAYKALYNQDFATWRRMMEDDNQKLAMSSFVLQRWDYTDLLIPTELRNHVVLYPEFNRRLREVEINPPDKIKYDYRDRLNLIYTYPVQKTLAEDELDTGMSDYDTWGAEWRCQFIESSGNVYPQDSLDRACETELIDPRDASRFGWNIEELGPHYPPLLFDCEDPCVLGVDPARTDDFTAFVVIRVGELGKGDYNPVTGCGETAWNNVIWAEQRRRMTIREIADKIVELKSRYNLIVSANPDMAPGVVIDARGAASGTTVRDELARPTPPVDEFGNVNTNWKPHQKMYDPTDSEYRSLSMDKDAWPGLRLLWTTDQMNTELVSFTRGQFQTARLYIPKYLDTRSRVDPEGKLHVGYLGAQSLKHQLQSVQSIPTKYNQRFEMPGNERRVDMKKDLFSAFLYASFALRAHLSLQAKRVKAAQPEIAGMVIPKRPAGLASRPTLY